MLSVEHVAWLGRNGWSVVNRKRTVVGRGGARHLWVRSLRANVFVIGEVEDKFLILIMSIILYEKELNKYHKFNHVPITKIQ